MYWIYYRFNADWVCCFCALSGFFFVYFRACSRLCRLVAGESFARIQGHNVVFYCLCTVNKIIDLLLRRRFFFFRFSFACATTFKTAIVLLTLRSSLAVSMMHLIINTLSRTYVAKFHPLLLIHLSRGFSLSRFFPCTLLQLLVRSIFHSPRFADVIAIAVRVWNNFRFLLIPSSPAFFFEREVHSMMFSILYRFSGEFLLRFTSLEAQLENEVAKQKRLIIEMRISNHMHDAVFVVVRFECNF